LLSPKYYLYLATNSQGQIKFEISSNPRVDAFILEQEGYHEMHLLQPPQPIWIAELVLAKLRKLPNLELKKFLKIAPRLINEVYPQKKITLNRQLTSELKVTEFDPPKIEPLFRGRSLLGTEVPELLSSNGFSLPWDPELWLQYLYLNSKIQRQAAVSIDSLGIPYCRRCGSTSGLIEDNCIFCGSRHCYTCTNCQTMGIAKSCIPLYSVAYPDFPRTPSVIEPRLDFELTPPQQRASAELVKFLDSENPSFLVWAVCGGGKTEVSFNIVAKVLSAGARVLVAIPRKDVVIELAPRFQKAFPEVPVTALFGGSGERYSDTPLTLATTHQCLRFFQGFDLVILDEADAFPYQGSAMLHYAVRRSLKCNGRLVIMTATPDKTMVEKAHAGKIPYVSIPARYHRQPLIIPELIKLDIKFTENPNRSWEPPAYVQQFLLKVKSEGRKALIFLPTIKLIEEFGAALVKWAGIKGVRGECAHSRSVNRAEVKTGILNREIDFLVTSTIFERGITIPDLDVLVLFADNQTIFDSRTLIQIAGRASRLGDPAQVIFVAKTISGAMKECCQWIETMNREGFKLGYLDRQI
jgi:competence protein ComFA